MAIDMTQKGMGEEEVFKEIADKYKSTMAVVEKQVVVFASFHLQACEVHKFTPEQYKASFEHYAAQDLQSFKNACYPCRFLLSKIENTPIEDPGLPKELTPERTLILYQGISELSNRCIDRILAMLCKEMNLNEEHVKKAVTEHPSLQNQVFDLVIDAEKGSKKKILQDEGVEEAQLIICNLLYRDDEQYSKQLEAINAPRSERLARLGLSN